MRYFGEIPRALGAKRKPIPDLAVLLDVLNEDEPHVHSLDVWDQIVADLKTDLAIVQALRIEAREGFDETIESAITIARAYDGSNRARWEPPFDPPSSLIGSFAAQQSYYWARRGLWALVESNAAHLVHVCFADEGTCAERPYVFARETCQSKACIMGALRHARQHSGDARELLRLWDEIRRSPNVSEDDLIELDTECPPVPSRKRV